MIPQARPPPCNESINSCSSTTFFQLFLLCTSFALISIGAGGIRSSSLAFGSDQLEKEDGHRHVGMMERYFSWYYASYMLSLLIALTSMASIQDSMGWQIGYGVLVVLMFFAALSFFIASPLYVKAKAKASLITEFVQKKGSKLVCPTSKLRFLNKACFIRDPQQDLALDGTAMNPWRLCTVDQVEDLKALLKVIPMWSTGMMTFINVSQYSFPVLQASSMNRKIIGNFGIPAAVEHIRRNLAIKEGISDDPLAIVHMSALWLLPQYCLMGLAEGLNAIAQNEFYISELPRSMSSLASTLCGVGMCVASLLASFIISTVDDITKRGGQESWISSNINKGHYDYYYWVLSGLSLVNIVYFLICCWTYGPCKGEEGNDADEEVLLQ
ncbi:hypothetical protein ACH5RR_041191 [Cinchona calisaya]|uniref:Uncharacterized protein n=1 Tax=Cinchona calisaya TaxID=153742 RepID=A0ABD2XW33_9GENT